MRFYFLDRNVSARHSTGNASQHVPPLLPTLPPPSFPSSKRSNLPPPFSQRVNLPEFDEREDQRFDSDLLATHWFFILIIEHRAWSTCFSSLRSGEKCSTGIIIIIIIETLFQLQKEGRGFLINRETLRATNKNVFTVYCFRLGLLMISKDSPSGKLILTEGWKYTFTRIMFDDSKLA